MSLTQVIKDEARRLGFHLVGVTSPEPPPHVAVFETWLAAGRHGEMAYLASDRSRQRRADPRQILPECRSILALGIAYPRPGVEPDASTSTAFPAQQEIGDRSAPSGMVAAYAWGADYHELLAERLQALVAFIEERLGHPAPNRWYTDTGPVLERDLAQRAGLGWIGKNTCLIHPRAGSYFLLAEILLGIELEPDPPFTADHCGSCTRCLDACPTGCILPDRTLDASRCISYLTIELKGAIPLELRQPTGEWIFGCDICQQVCPWNLRFAGPQPDPAFLPREERDRPRLISELQLTPAEFNRKYKRSPVRRTKRRGYLRNAAVALGNALRGSGDLEAVSALAKVLLHEPEALVRAHAAWALGQVGGEQSHQVLETALLSETEPTVLAEIRDALACLKAGVGS